MMSSHYILFFSLLIISSIILVSSFGSSFADEIIATSTEFEDSAILELKNSRGNTVDISIVRIWLSGENEFKSFKTEQGWMGKKQLNGVIEFRSQNEVTPGQNVKFGIKTTEKNPTINWKAIDKNGNVIKSASITSTISEIENDTLVVKDLESIGINEDSSFRLIPERPSSGSDFRVIGKNFVPGQELDFYIGNNFDQEIKANSNGEILFTSKTSKNSDDERVEFILRDFAGNEKIISLRIVEAENRDIVELTKLSIGNTPKEVKLGQTITLSGMATSGSTLTITSKQPNGDILDIQTIRVNSDGRWTIEQLISPETGLGQVAIEVSDGKTKILRNLEVISPALINLYTAQTMYQPGDIIQIVGKAIPDQDMSIILEDSIGAEIYSRSISVGDAGNVDFTIELSRNSVEGTYTLYLFQGLEEGITLFGVGQEPESILILKSSKLNYKSNEDVKIIIQSIANAQISLILIDSADREILSDTINLGPDGREVYKIDSGGMSSGAFTMNAKRGESTGEVTFTVGFTSGSGAITIQTTKDEYKQNEQVLILGNTGSINVLLDIIITDPSGEIIKRVETFSDKFGVFKIDNFRIPADAEMGLWTVSGKSGGNFKDTEFVVIGESSELIVKLDKTEYTTTEIITITGSGTRSGSTVTFKIFDENGLKVDELNINAKGNGYFSTIWKLPDNSILGTYEIIVDDGIRNTSVQFTLN